VGSAVVRNRVRRRLRALVGDEHRAVPLPAGVYVFHVDPPAAEMSFASLSATLHDLLTAVRPPVTA
jgi:ribonuclease P protein component